MLKSPLWISRFGILILIVTAIVFSHPTGVSKIDLTFREDTLETRIDVNRADLFYALNFPYLATTPNADFSGMSDQVAYYFQTRLDLKFDGAGAENPRILSYRKHGEDPALKLDSLALEDTTIVLRFAWPIPAGTRKLEVSAKLFAELEVQPLSHVRVFYRDQEIDRRFLGLDNRMFIPIEKGSLEAAYTKALHPDSANIGGQGQAMASASEESIIGRFLWLGFTHILPEGKDHILFVLGLFFFSIMLRPLLLQITAFTVAHSITLGLSLFNVISLSARIVEPLIALSIVIVAVENIFFRKMRPSRFLVVFGFGLIHGLGFAAVLKGLGLPEGQFVKVLISFNLGVEAGQLTVVAVAAALTVWMWHRPWYFRRVVVPISLAIAAIGLFWFIQRVFFI